MAGTVSRLSLAAVLAMGLGAMGENKPFVEGFARFKPDFWARANYQFSHPAFDTDWSENHVILNGQLGPKLAPQKGQKNGYLGASIRRQEETHFGFYEAELIAAKGPGLITGFFTYTGSHYGTQHDEIDIEILGKNTTMLHVAWFVDGKLRDKDIPLGFDASKSFHRYAFEWQKDRISWFVDGKMVFQTTAKNGPIPQTPSFVFANLWEADKSIKNWAGTTKKNTEATASFKRIKFTPTSDSPTS